MESRMSPMAGTRSESRMLDRPYLGETYYDLPAIKQATYGWEIATYFFIGGLASAAQFLATIIDLFGKKEDRPLVHAGRTIALAGALISPPLLIADLHTPQRWYNMLRIFRRTSAMSIGSWALSGFGILSGLTWSGQALEDLTGWKIGRWMARFFSLPAALAGGGVAIYTGNLLADTATPLWSSAFPYLSSLFASSATSTAVAALSLVAVWKGVNERTRRSLEWFSLVPGAAELFFALTIQRHWHRDEVDRPMRQLPLGAAWNLGVLGLATGAPLAIHAWQVTRRNPSKSLSVLAASAMLVGGFILRAVFLFGGRKSQRLPRDYFRNAQRKSKR